MHALFGELKFFNFKQGRMIPYEVYASRLLGNAMSAMSTSHLDGAAATSR